MDYPKPGDRSLLATKWFRSFTMPNVTRQRRSAQERVMIPNTATTIERVDNNINEKHSTGEQREK